MTDMPGQPADLLPAVPPPAILPEVDVAAMRAGRLDRLGREIAARDVAGALFFDLRSRQRPLCHRLPEHAGLDPAHPRAPRPRARRGAGDPVGVPRRRAPLGRAAAGRRDAQGHALVPLRRRDPRPWRRRPPARGRPGGRHRHLRAGGRHGVGGSRAAGKVRRRDRRDCATRSPPAKRAWRGCARPCLPGSQRTRCGRCCPRPISRSAAPRLDCVAYDVGCGRPARLADLARGVARATPGFRLETGPDPDFVQPTERRGGVWRLRATARLEAQVARRPMPLADVLEDDMRWLQRQTAAPAAPAAAKGEPAP